MSESFKKLVIILCAALLLCSCNSEYTKNYSNAVEPSPKATMPQQQPESLPADVNDAAQTPLTIGIHEAILMAMENNQSLIVERMNPEIQKTFEQQELDLFDPLIAADASSRRPRLV